MLNIDLSFAYYESTIYRGSYLFAHADKEFKVAEPTTDHLMFYGFGSGVYATDQKRHMPKWIGDFNFYNLPDIVTLQQDFSQMKNSEATALIVNRYIGRLRDLMFMNHEKGLVPDRAIIKRLIQQLCLIIRCDLSYDVLDNVVAAITKFNDAVPEQFNGYKPIDTCLVSGINSLGNHYMYVGFPRAHADDYPTEELEDRDSTPKWKYATEVGPLSNALSTLRSLRKTKFSSNLGPEYFDSLIDKVRILEPHSY